MPRPTPSPLPPPLPSYTFAADGHSYNFVVDGPFAFLAVSQEGSGRALAFSFLETVRAEWAAKWADKGRTAPAGGLDRAFGPRLAAAAAHVAAHPDEASRVAGLQAQVDAVKSVMVDNIEQARGGRGRGREEGDGGAVNPPSALASSPRSSPAASASRPWSTRRTTCAPRPTGFSAPGPRCAGGREGGGGRAARPSPPNPPTRPQPPPVLPGRCGGTTSNCGPSSPSSSPPSPSSSSSPSASAGATASRAGAGAGARRRRRRPRRAGCRREGDGGALSPGLACQRERPRRARARSHSPHLLLPHASSPRLRTTAARMTARGGATPVKRANWAAACRTNISTPSTVATPAPAASLSSRVSRGV